MGIGVTSVSDFRLNVLGNVKIDGNLLTTGTGGIAADKYTTRTYTGDGNTLTFAITTFTGGIKHTPDSLLVFLNGVAQIGGTNYTVDVNGANIVFGAGDAPLSTDTIHILELPI